MLLRAVMKKPQLKLLEQSLIMNFLMTQIFHARRVRHIKDTSALLCPGQAFDWVGDRARHRLTGRFST